MTDNERLDKLTEQAIGLYLKYNKDKEEDYSYKQFKHYKYLLDNMENIEKNTGILTKDFIKKLINREKELENEVFELKETIKSLKSVNDESVYIPMGYNMFLNMIKHASISISSDGKFNDINTAYNYTCLSIDNYPLTMNELIYIQKLLEQNKFGAMSKSMTSTYCGSDKADITTTATTKLSSNLAYPDSWYEMQNLANDRAWP